MVSDGGMRVDTVSKDREAMTTGSYRPGFCYAEGILSAGTYTIIVSTFKPGQVGDALPFFRVPPFFFKQLLVCTYASGDGPVAQLRLFFKLRSSI